MSGAKRDADHLGSTEEERDTKIPKLQDEDTPAPQDPGHRT